MAIVGAASNIKCYTVKLAVDSKANKDGRITFLEVTDECNNGNDGPILYVRYNSIPNNLLYIGECEKKYRVESGFYSIKKAKSLNIPAGPYKFRNEIDFKTHYVDVYQLDPSIYGNSDDESKSNREKLEQYVRICIDKNMYRNICRTKTQVQ